VNACNPDHYFGQTPSIDLVKLTNGTDNDTPTGPQVMVGSTVTWTYRVTNTGNVTLTNVTVTDDKLTGNVCVIPSMAPGAVQECTATGTAVAGQYANMGSVTGQPPSGPPVTDDNPDHYLGLEPAAISGFVYVDSNNDGIKGGTEAPIAGTTVTLTGTDVFNVAVSLTTTTNSTGYYEFTNLVPGTYTIVETQPAGYLDGKDTQGTPGTGTTGADTFVTVTLASGQTGTDNNFGELQASSLSGFVYVDADDDGIKDAGEAPISGVTVTLTGTDINGTPVSSVTTTDANGYYEFVGLVPGTYTITETQPVAYLDGKDTQGTPGTGETNNDQFAVVVLESGVNGTNNNFGERQMAPAITLVKKTNGTDNNSAPGLYVPTGSPVSWTYVVTNTGNVALNTVTVTDDKGVSVSCPATTLAVDASMTCSGTGVATAGAYVNIGCATAKSPAGEDVNACNPDHYFGSSPAITLVKKTNGTDNNTAPGIEVPVGSTVTWTYLVTNTGNVTLTNLALTDDKIGSVSCPVSSLAPGASTTCTATGVAIAGQYTNIGTVTGKPPVGPNVTASDPDNYFGKLSEVCYVGTSAPQVGGNQTWWTNPDGTITIRTTLSRNFVDNTYGTGQIGWPGNNHTFSHLVKSDAIQVALYNGAGAKAMEVKLDYLTESSATASGYKALGIWGGDGAMISGSASDVVSADSSLSRNFNQFGYVLTSNSPATTAAYAPNSSYPNWIFDVYYDVTVKASAFGASGFGYPRLTSMHASPSKTGNNTEPVKVVDCNNVPPPDPPCVASTYVFNQSTSSNGTAGNIRTFEVNGITVKASAFSRDKSNGSWAKAYLGSFGSYGLGVTDGSESGSGTTHTVDNNGRNNYVMFVFEQPVVVTKAFLGYVSGDSDAQVWVGNLPGAFATPAMLSDSVLAGLGSPETSLGGSTTRWVTFNGSGQSGNVVVIAAKTTDSNDYFKIAKVETSCPSTPPPPPPCTVPVANNDIASVVGSTPVTINVLNNDSDPDQGTLTISGFTQPVSGTVSLAGNKLVFTAAPGFTGTATFTYTVKNEGGCESGATVTVTVTAPEPPCQALSFPLNQNSSSNGSAGNIRTFSAGGVGVKVSAFSREKNKNTWAKAYVGAFGSYGLGVTDGSESGSGVTHTVDNNGRNNYLMFVFDEPVVVTRAFLGYVSGDSDAQVWVGTINGAYANAVMLSDSVLSGLGAPESSTGSSSTRWVEFNGAGESGNVVVIAANTSHSDDAFKVAKIETSCAPAPRPEDPPSAPCAFRTQTQGGWGSSPSGNNPGAFLAEHFTSVFGASGVTIGGSKKLTFTSSTAVRNFLPQGGKANKLTSNGTNVTSSSAGVFAGQVLALQISVAMSEAGKTPAGLAALKVKSGPLAGKTVGEVLALANKALGGQSVGISITTLNSVVDSINQNFVDGIVNKGYLVTNCEPQSDDHNHQEGDCRDDSHDHSSSYGSSDDDRNDPDDDRRGRGRGRGRE
ncbi:MAG: SdrD B-like domain-containing protein, partial [Vicinamibacterales bacterium]